MFLIVDFVGVMDEHAKLPVLPESPKILINLDAVTYINSVGVRLWIRWLQEVTKKSEIILDKCPVLFVKNLSSIKGMLTKNTKVNSFYVPYYDEVKNERRNVLFTKGQEFFPDGTVRLPRLLNSENVPIEPDVIIETYFSFLNLV